MKGNKFLIINLIILSIGLIGFALAQPSSQFWYPDSYDKLIPVDTSWGLTIPPLTNCNTIDTNASGTLACGSDDGGGAAATWLTVTANAISPTTTIGIIVNASSTFSATTTFEDAVFNTSMYSSVEDFYFYPGVGGTYGSFSVQGPDTGGSASYLCAIQPGDTSDWFCLQYGSGDNAQFIVNDANLILNIGTGNIVYPLGAGDIGFGKQGNAWRDVWSDIYYDETTTYYLNLDSATTSLNIAGGMIANGSSTFIGDLTVGGNATTTGNFAAGSKLYVYSGGNVGIGTATPNDYLHILTTNTGNQDMLSLEAAYENVHLGPALKFIRTNGVLARIRGIEEGSWDGGLAFEVFDLNGGAVGRDSTTTEAMRIDQYGNVGIGTTTPAYPFVVNSASANSFYVDSSGNATTSALGIRGLTNCDTIDTDANGVLSCGSDSGAFSTTTNDFWLTTKDTDDLTEGSNLYNVTHTGEATGATWLTVVATTSAEWALRITDETGSGSGSPLLVFNTNPVLTGATFAGIIADNDDMVFEVDADNNGSNKFSWTDGAAGEVMSLTEAGLLAVDTIVGSTGNPVIIGDSQYDRLEMADNGATKTSIAQQNSNNFAIVVNGFHDGTWDNYDTSKHTLLHNFLITDPPYFAWSVAQPTAGVPSFTQIMSLTEAGNLQFDGTLTVGAVQWDNGSSKIDGEQIADNTIDVDSLDWGAFTDLGESGIVNWGNITAGELANDSIIDADIDDDGNFTFTGTWNFTGGDIVLPTTSVDAGTYAAASIDGDDINSNIAGRSLTLTGASPDTLDADPELYTDVKCIWIENPVATDDLKSIWTSNGFSTVITKIWCESDQADGPQLNLRIDDGAPAGVNGADLDCDNTPAEDENMEGDDTMADGDRLDLEITSVGGSETWLSVCWTLTRDD